MEFTAEQFFIVTGASSGIGEEIAVQLNREGASVIGIGRDGERLEAMRARCPYPEHIYLEQKELTEDIDALPAYVTSLRQKFGRLHGLVCCAGIVQPDPLMILNRQKLAKTFAINYDVPVLLTKGFADRRNNTGRGAAILYVASIAAQPGVCEKSQGPYSGSKAALIATGKSFARELIPQGIRLNCVSPADIESRAVDTLVNDGYREINYPLGVGQPDDVAGLSVFLLSEKAKWIAGQNYIIDCCCY